MRQKIILLLPYICYVVLIVHYFKEFLYQITPDSISYIDIAQHYANYDFYAALNGYWSPLVSWLMAFLFKIHAFSPTQKIWAFKCLNAFGGIGSLFILSKITAYFIQKTLWRMLTLVSAAAWLAFLVSAHLTADVLLLPLLLSYWYLILEKQWLTRPYILGVVGAFIYFAKYYCFFPFLIHYHWKFFSSLNQITPPNKRNIYVNYGKTITTFGLIVSVWIGLLSYKYGSFTLSTAGGFNHAMMIDGTLENYCFRGAIMPLPHPKATFFWEDIALTCHYTDWSPIASWDNMMLQKLVITNNLRQIKEWLFYLLPITNFLGVIVLLYLLGKYNYRRQIGDIVVWIVIYLGGYILLEVQDRFLWIVLLFIILLTAFFIDQATNLYKPSKAQLYVLILVFLYFNLRIVYEKFKEPHWAIDGYNEWCSMANNCHSLRGSHIAAFETNDKIPWYMAYYTQSHYFGGIKPLIKQPDTLNAILQQYRIEYLLLPKTAELPNSLTQQFEQICQSTNYIIYKQIQ